MDFYVGVKTVLKTPGPVIEKKITLSSGANFPIIGLGTYKIRGRDILNVLDVALASGYRSFDTASVYDNEADIGEALQSLLLKYNLTRKDIFITSKLSTRDQGDRVVTAVRESLSKLKTDYLDLYLIHWPGIVNVDASSPRNAEQRSKSWLELEKLHYKGNGILKSIGVSNYTTHHLRELLEFCTIVPAVNQVEFHPHYQQDDSLYDICQKSNILLQAYSSLGGGNTTSLLEEPAVSQVAEKYCKTPAQILLRWALQCGYAIIPKSVNSDRISNNCELDFELLEPDFRIIKTISFKKKYAWDPETVL